MTVYILISNIIYLPDIHFVFPFGIEQLQLFATDDGDMVANITFQLIEKLNKYKLTKSFDEFQMLRNGSISTIEIK